MTQRNFFIGICLTLTCVFAFALRVNSHPPAATHGLSEETALLRIVHPNGGETFLAGDTVPIIWDSHGIFGGRIILVLYRNGVKHLVISPGCPDSGRFEWRMPESLAAGTGYRIRIRWSLHPEVNDFSDADFQILEKQTK
ncbi:MAG: hypothetical protein RB296_07740 [Acidobacteriota bacterium]|jgi:hypothetical protein|nr:hypothetical protein [Acidobacteriota bacterium]